MNTKRTLFVGGTVLLVGATLNLVKADEPRDDIEHIYSYEDALDEQPEEAVKNAQAPAFDSAPYLKTEKKEFEQAVILKGTSAQPESASASTGTPHQDTAVLDEDPAPSYGSQTYNTGASEDKPWDLSLGIAVASVPEYMGAKDNDLYVVPFVRAEYKFDTQNRAFFNPYEGLGFRHILDESWQVGARASLRKNRDSSDDASLSGMPDIDVAVEAGPFVRYKYDSLTLGLDVLADVSGEHDGYVVEANAKLDVPMPMNNLRANVGVEALYGNNDFMDHYFRVLPGQATATRAAYNPGSGMASVGANAMLTYWIDKQWFLTGNVGVTKLTGDAADSPLTRDDTNLNGFLALGYHF